MRRISLSGRKNSPRAAALRLEALEDRRLLSSDVVSGGYAVPGPISIPLTPAQVAMVPTGYTLDVPEGTVSPAAAVIYTPAQIRHAYGVDQLTEDGTGQTIAIVDAFSDLTATTDLTKFDSQFGLPAANFTVVTPEGTPVVPTGNEAGWITEMALDVEWAHAIAPGAKIMLYESIDDSDTNLLTCVSDAVKAGANEVSMSWGEPEFSGESTDDSYFNSSPGVSFVAATGDSGGQVNYPAVSPYVTGVGGTSLTLDSSGNYSTESAWYDGGGGASTITAEPSYQKSVYASSYRGTPDVAYDASLSSGFYIIQNGSLGGVGGTSCGSPQWASLIALANQGRVSAGETLLGTGQTYGTNTALYQLAGTSSNYDPGGDFHDITTGNNGYAATTGYDLATGLGTPVANKLIPDLIAQGSTGSTGVPTVGDSGFESVVVGSGKFAYDPTGSAWSFSGYAGVSGNGSAFTSGDPNAPQGVQVGFVQETGSITQSVAGWAAGSYTISFDSAQRVNQQEDFEVLVNGNVVGTFKPTGNAYQAYTTSAFSVTAATNTIEFLGLDSVGGDNTAFLDAVTVAVAGPPPNGPTVGDPGFESVVVGAGNYQYDPTGSAWTFAGYAGVSGNGSAFTTSNPNAPQGVQVGFVQETGSITQSVPGWAVNSYTISFDAAQRGNMGNQREDFEVLIDGKVVGSFLPSSTSYQLYTTPTFSITTAGSHTVEFLGLDSVGGDNTALIDAVTVAVSLAATSPTLGDPGFESVPVGTGNYQYNPVGSAWTFAGYAGVSGNGSGFTSGNANAPQGSQVGFVQETGSITQSVSGWGIGSTYTISFDAAQRGNYSLSQEDFEVLVAGKVVGTFKPTGSSYQVFTTSSFTVSAATNTVEFLGLDSVGGDNTALIDAVAIGNS